MASKRLPPWSLLAAPGLLLIARVALSRAPADLWPTPDTVLSFPNFALIRAVEVVLAACWGALVVYVVVRGLRRGAVRADTRAALLLLAALTFDVVAVFLGRLDGPIVIAGLLALTCSAATLVLMWVYLLVEREWRTAPMYAAFTAVLLPPTALAAALVADWPDGQHWSPAAQLRLPDGRTYHLLHVTKTCVSRDVLLEQTRPTWLQLEGRVLESNDAEGGGPALVRPSGTTKYDPPPYDPGGSPSPRRLISVDGDTLLLVIYYTHYRTGKIACASSLGHDFRARADHADARNGPFSLIGPDDELNRDDVEALLAKAAGWAGSGLALDATHPNPRVRAVVAEMLGRVAVHSGYDLRTEMAVRARVLRRLARDPDPSVRRAAAQALTRL